MFPGTEAANANVIMGVPSAADGEGYVSQRVVLIDPKGIDLTFLTADTNFDLAGEGPLIDIVVNWIPDDDPDPDCSLADGSPAEVLKLENMSIFDVDGNLMSEKLGPVEIDRSADGFPSDTAIFRGYAVDIPPPPIAG